MEVTFDAADVLRVISAYPAASARVLAASVEAGAIDFQRDMRKRAPVHDGEYRRSIRYKLNRAALSAVIGPSVNYAEWVEKGSRPHWVSVREGSPLRKWAEDHGIEPRAVQYSIARKGTKGQYVVDKTFNFNHRAVEAGIVKDFERFIKEVDSGRI